MEKAVLGYVAVSSMMTVSGRHKIKSSWFMIFMTSNYAGRHLLSFVGLALVPIYHFTRATEAQFNVCIGTSP
jgi:hypothetical protein